MLISTSPRIRCRACKGLGKRWFAFGDLGPTRICEKCAACPDCGRPTHLTMDPVDKAMVLHCPVCATDWELTFPATELF